MRKQRGFTLVSFLMLVGATFGIYWLYAFGPAYWDNFTVRQVIKEAANFSYHERRDSFIRGFVDKKLHEQFDTEEFDTRGTRLMRIAYDVNDDLRIELTEKPPSIDLWFTYRRPVSLPLIGRERTIVFSVHADQDLSTVKW